MSDHEYTPVQRVLAASGAWLLALGMITGIPVAAAMTGRLDADGSAMLASHLNALMGTFWIFAVAWSIPLLRYGEQGQRLLATLVITASYSNWFITAVKALLKVRGLDLSGSGANVGIAVSLDLFVVVPTLVAAIAWALGFRRRT